MFRSSKITAALLSVIPILWATVIAALLFAVLQTIKVDIGGKLDQVIENQNQSNTSYSVEIETFDQVNGRLIYVPIENVSHFPTAQREFYAQVTNAFASCEAGTECLDSVHVWLFKDTPKGPYIVRDTALTPNETR